jgi:DnaJ-class molecular chaperone
MELRRKNYFEILGVGRNATADDVKKAYFALARDYHPDRHYNSSSAEIKNLASEIYNLITQAYETLVNEQEREAYLKEMSTGAKRDVSDEVSRILAAEGQFQQGEMFLRKRQFAKAAECFNEAINLYPEEGEFYAYYGWSMFQANPSDEVAARQAHNAISTAVSLNPKIDKAYLFLGYIYKAQGNLDMAEQQFEKAIQCNPDSTEALRELRLKNLRRGKKGGSGGLFKRG